ncbi:MAG: Hydroxyacylglutathione hydrolase [Syntrophus sp. SKADARSKE-3]|nr:Hydroxyacylglutathione hydrolase [Syntrophus sp. SKADARSKE-3]
MKLSENHLGPVWFLPGDNRGRYPFCHSLFLPESGILIDPGSNRERLKQLKHEGSVKAVWLSHWHEDHFKDLDLFDHLPLFISQADALPLSGIEHLLAGYDIETEFPYWQKVMIEQFHFRPRTPAGCLEGGQTICLDGLTIDLIPAPGHTPGHLAFYFREPEILFLADYDLTPFGPWYGDHSSSIDDTISSLRRLKGLPAKIWITSHERGIFDALPLEKWQAYEGVIYERENRLLSALAEPLTLNEICNQWIVYGKPREPLEFFESCERALMKKHLERLMKQEKISLDNGRYRCMVPSFNTTQKGIDRT